MALITGCRNRRLYQHYRKLYLKKEQGGRVCGLAYIYGCHGDPAKPRYYNTELKNMQGIEEIKGKNNRELIIKEKS